MAFSIASLVVNSGPELYYSKKWIRTIREHVPFLKSAQTTQVIQVPANLAHANRNNVAGLLNDLKIPQESHFLLTMVNGWDQAEELDLITQVLVPSDEAISRLRKLLPAT